MAAAPRRWWLPVLLGLAVNAADVASATRAFADARLRLQVLGQEVADLESRGEAANAARASETRQVAEEKRLVGTAADGAAALAARRAAAATEVGVLKGLRLRAAADAMQKRAKALGRGAARMDKHAQALRVRATSLATTLHAVQARYDKLAAAEHDIPGKLESARAREHKNVNALRRAARTKLKKLQQKEKAAAAAHNSGEVAALKWEEGRVKAAYSATKASSADHELKLTSDLYVAKKQAPYVAGKKTLLTTELARVRSQLANEENRSARAQAEARNLTVQAALRRIEATVDIGVQPTNLTNRSLADAEKDLSRLDAEVPAAEAAVGRMKSALAADEHGLAAQVDGRGASRVDPASAGGLDASVLDSDLATDTSDY